MRDLICEVSYRVRVPVIWHGLNRWH